MKIEVSPIPAGAVMPFAGANIPNGYLACDGSQVSRTTYAKLFAAIGVAHGSGDGSTTFHLPDYRGRFLRGLDAGAGRDPDVAGRTAANTGGNTGNAVGSVQGHDFLAHGHQQKTTIAGGGINSASTGSNSRAAGVSDNACTTNNTGGNETRPLNAAVNYIIKV